MDYHGIPRGRVGVGPHEGGQLRRDAHSRNTPRGAQGPRLPPQRAEAASRHQGRQCPAERDGRREACRFRRRRAADQHDQQEEHLRGDAVLDGARSHQAVRVRLEGGHLEPGDHGDRAG